MESVEVASSGLAQLFKGTLNENKVSKMISSYSQTQ